jgi:predicted alpha/beta-fold hydrolase
MRRFPAPLIPPIWARGGHAQTILGHVLPSPGRPLASIATGAPIVVPLAKGDVLVGHACQPAGAPSPVRVHLFHGLSGDADADYMRAATAGLLAAGHQVWAFNHRGAGQGAGRARGIYHSGRYDDIAAVLAASRRERPDQVQLVVGFSLSGNAALLLAAEWATARNHGTRNFNGLEVAPDALIAINPPIDLEDCSLRLQAGLNRLYQARFVRRLRRVLEQRKQQFADFPALTVPRGATLWDVDECVTAPLGAFVDARDYYATCSTAKRLEQIEVPTVIVMSADDPFVDVERLASAPAGPHVFKHIEATGGHVGYLHKRGTLGYGHWLPGAIAHYAAELVSVAGAAKP